MERVSLKNTFSRHRKQLTAVLMVIIIFVVGEISVGNFFSLQQVLIAFKFASFIALFGLAQMMVIASGGDIDLSVGFTATLVAVLTASVMDGENLGNAGLVPAIIMAIGIGALIGFGNGVLTTFVKLPSLVVTMAMANILQGIINVYSSGTSITGRPAPVIQELAARMTGIFPNVLFVLIVVTVIIMVLMYKTRVGVKILGVGANPAAANLSGVNVRKVRTLTFIAAGVISGLMGILLIGNSGQAFKDMASQYVMPSIAAVVVGGVSLSGGEGNFVGVILGAMVLQTLTNLFVALGWGDAGKWMGYGLILLFMLIAYVREKISR